MTDGEIPGDRLTTEAQLHAELARLKAGLEAWLAARESAGPSERGEVRADRPVSAAEIELSLFRLMTGVQTLFRGIVSADETALAAAREEVRRLLDYLSAQGIVLPAALDDLPTEARAHWLAEQETRREAIAKGQGELAAAFRQAGEEISAVDAGDDGRRSATGASGEAEDDDQDASAG